MKDTILLLTYINFVISIIKKVAFHYIRLHQVIHENCGTLLLTGGSLLVVDDAAQIVFWVQ